MKRENKIESTVNDLDIIEIIVWNFIKLIKHVGFGS